MVSVLSLLYFFDDLLPCTMNAGRVSEQLDLWVTWLLCVWPPACTGYAVVHVSTHVHVCWCVASISAVSTQILTSCAGHVHVPFTLASNLLDGLYQFQNAHTSRSLFHWIRAQAGQGGAGRRGLVLLPGHQRHHRCLLKLGRSPRAQSTRHIAA